MLLLRLYVTAATDSSRAALLNIRRICEQELAGRYRLEVIDVFDRPDLAEADHVVSTPMLIRKLPPPLRRIVGDLSERQRVLAGLDLLEVPDPGARAGVKNSMQDDMPGPQ